MSNQRRLRRQVFKLPKRHRWKAKPGNNVMVLNRGEVICEIPQGWVVDDESGDTAPSIRIYDGPPPDDNIRLEVSCLRFNARLEYPTGKGDDPEVTARYLETLAEDVVASHPPLAVRLSELATATRQRRLNQDDLKDALLQYFDAVQPPLAEQLDSRIEDRGIVLNRGTPLPMELGPPGVEIVWSEMEFIDPFGRRPAFGRYALARGSGVQAFITMDFWPEDADKAAAAWEDTLQTLRLGQYMEHPFFGPPPPKE